MTGEHKATFKTKLGIFIGIIVLASFGIGVLVGNSASLPSSVTSRLTNRDASNSRNIDFALYWQVWDLVSEKFYKQPLSDEDRFYGSIKGMVSSLGDPYTAFMTPDETKRFQDDLDGSFQGIGIEIGMKDEILSVIAPLSGSPAEKAGLKAGDYILKIDDKDTSNLSLNDAVSAIRGQKGTTVKLNIVHKGGTKAEDVTITRDDIEVKTVEVVYLDNDNVAQIRLSRFGETTNDEFAKAIGEIRQKNVNKIILDLRNDPGGLLGTAVDIASKFIDGGQTVVIQKSGNGVETKYNAKGDSPFKDAKVVVLMNEGSASASEILAGALRDDRGVKLIGEKSYGKGSVQDVESLSDGSSIRITIARWLTPKGTSINETGLQPDTKVDITSADLAAGKDPQLDKALEVVKAL
jgi:carboxyl-terminal processing protease